MEEAKRKTITGDGKVGMQEGDWEGGRREVTCVKVGGKRKEGSHEDKSRGRNVEETQISREM